jgi:hypothetical protein
MFSSSKAEIKAQYMPPLAHLNFHLVIMAEWYMSNMLSVKSPEFAM